MKSEHCILHTGLGHKCGAQHHSASASSQESPGQHRRSTADTPGLSQKGTIPRFPPKKKEGGRGCGYVFWG